MTDIKLIQVSKPNVLAWWHFWQKDMADICGEKFSMRGDMTVDHFMNMLIHPDSQAILWAGFVGGKYKGFTVTVPDGDSLLFYAAKGIDGENHSELFASSLKNIEVYAKKAGFKKVKFVTKRDKAFMKKVEPLGYKAEQTIFFKEV